MSITGEQGLRESQADIVDGRPEPSRSLGRQQKELCSGNRNRRDPDNAAVLGHVSWVVKGSSFIKQLDP